MTRRRRLLLATFFFVAAALAAVILTGCAATDNTARAENKSAAENGAVDVGVVPVVYKPMARSLSLSSELVPYQEIDVYAKESGYVKQLLVDYGTRVKAGQLMAILEIPEMELQLQQDDAAIRSAGDQITHAQHEVSRIQAQAKVLHLQFDRLDKVSKSQPGLVAQQEVDDAQGKDLAAQAQVESAESNLGIMQSQLDAAKAKRQRDQVLYDYSKITAPFAGVVTQRYANLGTLMQAGTNSSTQALPLVKLSEDDKFRLVIPVPESYVRYIKVGDSVSVNVPSLGRKYAGSVSRFSVDVGASTRTMHTEVDIPNTDRKLLPGVFAEATLQLDRKDNALTVPLQALNQADSDSGQDASAGTVDVVDATNHIVAKPVQIGIQTSTDAEIVSGLEAGDKVIVSDRGALKAGQQVVAKPVNPPTYQGQ